MLANHISGNRPSPSLQPCLYAAPSQIASAAFCRMSFFPFFFLFFFFLATVRTQELNTFLFDRFCHTADLEKSTDNSFRKITVFVLMNNVVYYFDKSLRHDV